MNVDQSRRSTLHVAITSSPFIDILVAGSTEVDAGVVGPATDVDAKIMPFGLAGGLIAWF